MSEADAAAFPDDPPSDSRYSTQENLDLQGVPAAWRLLHARNPRLTLGSPAVTVATLDFGIEVRHPDADPPLSDGSRQLSRESYDFKDRVSFFDPGYKPIRDHGMGAYGIIAAATDNGCGIAGIAPNTRHLGRDCPTPIARLLGCAPVVAGFWSRTATGTGRRSRARGADVISCSTSRRPGCRSPGSWIARFSIWSIRVEVERASSWCMRPATTRRSSPDNAWAADPRSIAVSNTDPPDAQGVERLHRRAPKAEGSSFGPEIDLCSQGECDPRLT